MARSCYLISQDQNYGIRDYYRNYNIDDISLHKVFDIVIKKSYVTPRIKFRALVCDRELANYVSHKDRPQKQQCFVLNVYV